MDPISIYKKIRIGKMTALILAGGSGTRMGTETPKQHLMLNNIPVIVHTLLAFENDLNFTKRDAGKFWQIKDNCPVVICGQGLLKIEKAVFADDRNEVVKFNKVRCRLI